VVKGNQIGVKKGRFIFFNTDAIKNEAKNPSVNKGQQIEDRVKSSIDKKVPGGNARFLQEGW